MKTIFVIFMILGVTAHASAQFVPGGTINSASTTDQTLSSGTGTITSTGTLTIGGSTVAIVVDGASTTIENDGAVSQTGTGRGIRLNSGSTGSFSLVNHGTLQTADADTIQWNNGSAATTININNSGTVTTLGGGQAIDFSDYTAGGFTLDNASTGIILSSSSESVRVSSAAMITNAGAIESTEGDSVRVGANSIITNSGTIEANPIVSGPSLSSDDGIDTKTASGVEVTNSGTITGRHGVTGGVSSGSYEIEVINEAGGIISAKNGSGINIDGILSTVMATVENDGTIEGGTSSLSGVLNGDGDGVDVDGVVVLTNNGVIRGLGAKGVDSGGLPNNSEGVAAGGGTIINNFGAEISANNSTGDPTREGRGILIDDGSNGSGVAITTVTNSGLISGATGFAIKLVGDFADTVTNHSTGEIAGNGTSAAIQTGEGGDIVSNAGTITGNSGVAIQTEAGDDTVNITGGAIAGDIDGGTGTDTLTFTLGVGTFTLNDEISNFEALNLVSGKLEGSGLISSGTLEVDSGSTLSPGNSLGTLTVNHLTLDSGARLEMELGSTSDLFIVNGTLSGTGTIFVDVFDMGLAVQTYTLIDFDAISGLTAANFQLGTIPSGLVGNFVVNSSSVDLNVVAVPEPSSALLIVLALGWAMASRRRHSQMQD